MSSRAGSCRSERARSERARSERASERAGERARGHAVPQTGSGGLTPPGIWGYTGERAHAQQGGGSGLSGLSGPRSLCPRSLCLRSLCPRSLCTRFNSIQIFVTRDNDPNTASTPTVAGPTVAGPTVAGAMVVGPMVAGPTVICPRSLGPWSLVPSLRCEAQHGRRTHSHLPTATGPMVAYDQPAMRVTAHEGELLHKGRGAERRGSCPAGVAGNGWCAAGPGWSAPN